MFLCFLNNNIIYSGGSIISNTNINDLDAAGKISIHLIQVNSSNINTIIGFPKDAYSYGTLLTISNGTDFKYGTAQFYIPHNQNATPCIYIRTLLDFVKPNNSKRTWIKIEGISVDAIN